ncbi:TadE family type IV pilus minor pilin [Microbacterium sp. SORGH_AS_0888]|uniref:TadE family type IV pilus minor pilin n=1 Tax=Microbacterium sp. SORGH_AS_0888 TaxID=3041791 RepID=UPI0027D896EE|nr:TadE family type IV pilus minor pilin [Microbacterium sp. SORGH_AS_0888]
MTAEFAVALPAVVVVIALGVAALGAGARQVRLQDAAADAARLLARGDDRGRAAGAVEASVSGAGMAVEEVADLVCVTATAPAGLPGLTLQARSCALAGGL